MTAVYLNAMGVVCALGQGPGPLRAGLFADQPSGVVAVNWPGHGRTLHLGRFPGPEPVLDHEVPMALRSRSNALLQAALDEIRVPLQDALTRFDSRRVAVVLGTSAAGASEGEYAASYRQLKGAWPVGYDFAQQEMGSPSAFVAQQMGIFGPVHTISTACSSGAKTLASAARLLRAGIVDAVVAGGVDALSRLTIAGFESLESVAVVRCNPMSTNRCGINLGEGAALFLMTREQGPVRLAGWGETSEAYHLWAPDPSGRGAIDAMRKALERESIAPSKVEYLNMHGTATPHNDAMESRAVAEVFGLDLAVSSTKPLTGHALAAAGAIEAAIAWLTMIDNPRGRLPVHWWDGERDSKLPHLRLVGRDESLGHAPAYVLSNSFAFGGSNAALLFARE